MTPAQTLQTVAAEFRQEARLRSGIDPLATLVLLAASRRQHVLQSVLQTNTDPVLWHVVARYVVPEYETTIRRKFNDDPTPETARAGAEEILDLLKQRDSEYRRNLNARGIQISFPERAEFLRKGIDRLMPRLKGRKPIVAEIGSSAGLLLSELHRTHPEIMSFGVDLHPLHTNNPNDLRWLQSHYDLHHNRASVDDAIAYNQRHPPTLFQGNGVAGVEAVLAHLRKNDVIDRKTPVILVHVNTQRYMTLEEQADLRRFTRHEKGRDYFRISAENPFLVREPQPNWTQPMRDFVNEFGNTSTVATLHLPNGTREVFAIGNGTGSKIVELSPSGIGHGVDL